MITILMAILLSTSTFEEQRTCNKYDICYSWAFHRTAQLISFDRNYCGGLSQAEHLQLYGTPLRADINCLTKLDPQLLQELE